MLFIHTLGMSSSQLTHIFQRGRLKTPQIILCTYITVYIILVGGFKHFLFPIIYGIILPIDFHKNQNG